MYIFIIENESQTRHETTSYFPSKKEIERIYQRITGYTLVYFKQGDTNSEMFSKEIRRSDLCQIASNLPSIESALDIINSNYPNKKDREIWTQQRDCSIKDIIQKGDWFRAEGNSRISSCSGTITKRMRVNMRYESYIQHNPQKIVLEQYTNEMSFYGEMVSIHHRSW